jgi:RNA-directed DNA polymerase
MSICYLVILQQDQSLMTLDLLCNIVCFQKRLTIGSVTSPILTNAMCYDLDEKLSLLAISQKVTYSRYADDMFFSTDQSGILYGIPIQVKNIIRSIDVPKKLWLNFKKTHHSSDKRRKTITGLVITNDNRVSLGRKKKREIRSMIYQWDKLTDDQKKYTSGYLAYCKHVEPEFINSLFLKYGSIVMDIVIKFNSLAGEKFKKINTHFTDD